MRAFAAMIGLFALAAAAPEAASAQPWRDRHYDRIDDRDDGPRDRWRDRRGWERRGDDGWRRGDADRGRGRDWGRDGRYGERGYDVRRRDGRRYDDRRFDRGRREGRCRDEGNGGTIIGAIAGGLLGNGVAGRGDRTLGTILGGGAGALAGRAIDRDCR